MRKDEMWLVDTNILVYAFDIAEPKKRAVAQTLLAECWKGKRKLAVSLQNLSEFFFITTKKVPKPLAPEEAENIVSKIIRFKGWIKLLPDFTVLERSMFLHKKYGIPFWDALLAGVMIENRVFNIYTEDNDFSKMPGIKTVNPFSSK